MARRSDEGEKVPVTKAGLRKFIGIFRFVGQIAEAGTHQQLNALDNGIYSNLLKLQLEVTE